MSHFPLKIYYERYEIKNDVEVNLSSILIIQLFPAVEWIQNFYLQNFWC